MTAIPLFLRRIAFDFLSTAAPVLLALQFTGDPESFLKAAGAGLLASLVASIARNLPGLNDYLNAVLGLDPASTSIQ